MSAAVHSLVAQYIFLSFTLQVFGLRIVEVEKNKTYSVVNEIELEPGDAHLDW